MDYLTYDWAVKRSDKFSVVASHCCSKSSILLKRRLESIQEETVFLNNAVSLVIVLNFDGQFVKCVILWNND